MRYLVIGGLAVVVVGGEPRTTADADAIVFTSAAEDASFWGRLQVVLDKAQARGPD